MLDRIEILNDFIENASIPLHWVNGSGIIIWANKTELDFLGYSKEEYIGKHIAGFHADKEVIEDILTRLIKKEILINYPARLKCKDGSIKPVIINSNGYWKDERFIHTRCFTRDVSDLIKADDKKSELIENLLKKNEILSADNARLKSDLEALKKHNI